MVSISTESDTENDTSYSPLNHKRQTKTQKWESDANFKGWLSKTKKGPRYFHCRVCNTDVKLKNLEIEKHAEAKKHKKFAQARKTTKSVLDMPSVSGQMKAPQVKGGEIRLVAFLV